MLLLLKNEMSKISKQRLLFIWLGALIVISAITGIIIMGLGTDGKMNDIVSQNVDYFDSMGDKWSGWAIAASLFSILFTKVAFLFFEAYLISSIVIDEFRKRTIHQLFSYPIKKNQIMWSKIFLVILISFVGQLCAHFTLQLLITFCAMFLGVSTILTLNLSINLVMITLGTVILGLLPFVFGMIRYSTIITMLSALALAGLTSNAVPGTLSKSFVNTLPFILLTSLVSIGIVAVSIQGISKKDIHNY